jgi:hypothetical protein
MRAQSDFMPEVLGIPAIGPGHQAPHQLPPGASDVGDEPDND